MDLKSSKYQSHQSDQIVSRLGFFDVVGDCSVVVVTSVGTEKRLGKNGKGKKGNEIT